MLDDENRNDFDETDETETGGQPEQETEVSEDAGSGEPENAPEASEDAAETPAEDIPQAADEQPAPASWDPEISKGGAEKPAKKSLRSMLGKGFIPACVVLAVIIIGIVVSVAVSASGSPIKLVAEGAEKSMEAMTASDSAQFMSNFAESGSTEVSIDLSGITSGYIDGKINMKAYTGGDRSALVLDALIDGSKVLGASAFYSGDSLVLASDELLGKNAYGLDLKKAGENLPKSIFNPENGSDYALDSYTYEELLDELNSLSGRNMSVQKLSGLLRKAYDDVLPAALKSASKNAVTEKSTETIEIGDKSVKTTLVTITLDEKAMQTVVVDLLTAVKESKNVAALLDFLLTDPAYSEMLETVYGISIDKDEFYGELDELIVEAESLAGNLGDCELEIKAYISKSGKQLVKTVITLDDNGNKRGMTLTAGPDMKSPELVELIVRDGNDRYTISCRVSENSADSFSADLKAKENSTILGGGKFKWDKKSGDYSLSIDTGSDKLTVEGSMLRSRGTLELDIDSIANDYTRFDPGVTVVLREKDKMPSAPKYTDVLSLTENQVAELVEELSDNFYDIIYELGYPINLLMG